MLRLRSASDPFDDPVVAGQAARLLALVEALGIWQPGAAVTVLDQAVFVNALEALVEVGVAGRAAVEWKAHADQGPEELARWIGSVREAVVASPVPDVELPRLEALFGNERLAQLAGVGGSSLRRYANGDRFMPDDVAERVHLVARIVADLAGSYNERGIRRWFERPRAQLGGRTPEAVLRMAWASEGGVDDVVTLAADLAG